MKRSTGRGVQAVSALVMVSTLSACAGYRAVEESDPHGYKEERLENGDIKVSFMSYRKVSDDKLCDYALRRVHEISGDDVTPQGPVMQTKEERWTVPESRGYVPTASGPGPGGMVMQGQGTTTLTPSYVVEKTVRVCSWTIKAQ